MHKYQRITKMLLCAGLLWLRSHAAAATLKGSVRIDGDKDKTVVIYLEGAIKAASSRKAAKPLLLNKGKAFLPALLAVPAGGSMDVVNEDDIYHNAYSLSTDNPFDIGLQKRGERKEIVFKKAGRVDVFCAIHPEMHSLVLVLENPFFASTDENGRYSIEGVPPGSYTLKARHATLGEQSQAVVVKGNETTADFSFVKKASK